MAYTINLTDGQIFATIADGTINTASSMVLVGKNYAGYGEFLDENFIHLLENGANTVPPGAPLVGQLWWDKTNSLMKVFNGTTFKTISASTASPTPPSSNVIGDLWWDSSSNQQLKVWNGSTWVTIGPATSGTFGQSGTIVTSISDGTTDHVVVQLFVENVLVGTISKDPEFPPVPSIGGFPTIGPGIQLSTAVSNNIFRGIVQEASLLDGLDSTQFLRSDAPDTTSGTLGVLNDGGISFGLDQDGRLSVVTATSEVVVRNQTQDANLSLRVNDGGVDTTVMFVNGATGTVTLPTTVELSSITKIGANAVGNIGSSTNFFNRVFATSTSALYADVAERFAADQFMEPGTVVELGGEAEITISQAELSEDVFGVISTRAAYLMNSGAGEDSTHPPVAMTGRVPVRVVGTVKKGDRLVSAGNGLARAASKDEITSFNVIGRSLEDKINTEEGLVEAIVSIKN